MTKWICKKIIKYKVMNAIIEIKTQKYHKEGIINADKEFGKTSEMR